MAHRVALHEDAMSNEVKPGACPGCAKRLWQFLQVGPGIAVHCMTADCELTGPWKGSPAEAIAAWNGIEARVLREAAQIAHDALEDCHCTERCGYHAPTRLHEAADRAERGEP